MIRRALSYIYNTVSVALTPQINGIRDTDIIFSFVKITGLGLLGYPTPVASVSLSAGVAQIVPIDLILSQNPSSGGITLSSNALVVPRLTSDITYYELYYQYDFNNSASAGEFTAELYYDNNDGSGWRLLPISKATDNPPSNGIGCIGKRYRLRIDTDQTKIALFITCSTNRTITNIQSSVDIVYIGPVEIS